MSSQNNSGSNKKKNNDSTPTLPKPTDLSNVAPVFPRAPGMLDFTPSIGKPRAPGMLDFTPSIGQLKGEFQTHQPLIPQQLPVLIRQNAQVFPPSVVGLTFGQPKQTFTLNFGPRNPVTTNQQVQKNKPKMKTSIPCERSDKTKIYFYAGHGEDMCKNNELVKKIVPNNCIYITIEACGKPTKYTDLMRQLRTIAKNDPPNREILLNPDKHLEELAQLLGINQDLIHIHFCGMTYVDNLFYPMQLHYNYGNKPYLNHSGLMEKSEMELTWNSWPERQLNSCETFDPSLIPQYFQGSVWPTVTEITDMLGNMKNDNLLVNYCNLDNKMKQMSKSVSELMTEYPGIHYNLVCRSVQEPCSYNQVSLQQTQSLANQKKLYGGRKIKKTKKSKKLAKLRKYRTRKH